MDLSKLNLPSSSPPLGATESYLRVLHALMLRDMRTRFGASYWGYAVVVLWPCAHVFMLVTFYHIRKIPAPIGEVSSIFFASGAVPVLIYQYISREVMKAVQQNRPLTYYPQVKMVDVIFARVLVEIVTGTLGLMVVLTILTLLGMDPRPEDAFQALTGFIAAIMLGIGIGTVNVCIMAFFPTYQFGYIVINILLYITSGVMFLPNYLPEQIYNILKWNPAVHIIEWVRLGYYPTLDVEVDYLYVIQFALVAFCIGMLLEKFVVRKVS